jgi:hypothetical protein
LLLAVLGAVVAWPYLNSKIDEEIRLRVLAKFTTNYPGLDIEVRSAQLLKGEGIRIRDVTIREPGVAGPSGELATFDEIFLNCPTGLTDLMHDELPMRKITLRNAVIRATLGADGRWNAAKLWPIPKFSKKCADVIAVENGSFELIDPSNGTPRKLVIKDISLSLTPHDGTPEMLAVDRTMEMHGTFSSDHLQHVEIAGLMAPHGGGWLVSGKATGLSACPELCHSLPCAIASQLASAVSVRGEAEAEFKIQSIPGQDPPVQFEVAGQLTQGRIDDPILPYPLTDLQVVAHANNAGAVLDQFSARHGDTQIRLTAKTAGFRADSKVEIEGQTRHLTLDRRGAEALPEALRAQWKKFEPAGDIDADFKITFDGKKWHPEGTVDCLDVSFMYYKFPYRLERGTGRIELHDDRLKLQMTAFGGGQPLRFDGDFQHPGPDFTGVLEVRGKDLPLDDTLLAAMPDGAEAALRALNPRGTFNLNAKSWRTDPREEEMHHQLAVQLNRCSLDFARFRYPLANIRGTLEMLDHQWTFRDLEGTNSTGLIKCRGQMLPSGGGYDLTMHLDGLDIPLEDQLRDALKPNLQKLWNELKPHGSVNLGIDLRYLTANKEFDLALSGEAGGEGISVEPDCFPYRLERITGAFSYRDNHADFRNLRALHGRTTLASHASFDVQPEGGWRFQLKDFSVDRLKVDRDLVGALPPKLKKVVSQLNPTGALNLRGQFELVGAARPETPATANWDVEFSMAQGGVDCGVKFENVFGGVRLTGFNDGKHTQCHGELNIDSLNYKDFQVSEILGPMWIDDTRILLGTGAERPAPGKPSRRVTAKISGGTVAGDCAVLLGPTPQYSVRASLAEGDLARFVKEAGSPQKKLQGKVFGNVELSGTTQGLHTVSGRGKIALRDADIYELPVMVALLKILSVRPPDKTAFTTSDMDFRMQGDHIYFDKLEFAGDAISLVGKGEMNFESDLHMAFHSVVGRSDYQLPLLKNVMGTASQQFLLIHVDGNVANPHTWTEAFPGVQQALQQLNLDRPLGQEAARPSSGNNR